MSDLDADGCEFLVHAPAGSLSPEHRVRREPEDERAESTSAERICAEQVLPEVPGVVPGPVCFERLGGEFYGRAEAGEFPRASSGVVSFCAMP